MARWPGVGQRVQGRVRGPPWWPGLQLPGVPLAGPGAPPEGQGHQGTRTGGLGNGPAERQGRGLKWGAPEFRTDGRRSGCTELSPRGEAALCEIPLACLCVCLPEARTASPPPLPWVLTARAAGDQDTGFNAGRGAGWGGRDAWGQQAQGTRDPQAPTRQARSSPQPCQGRSAGREPRRGAGRRRAGLEGGAGGEPGAQRGQQPAEIEEQGLQRQAGPQLSAGPEPSHTPCPKGSPPRRAGRPLHVWRVILSAELDCTVSP